MNKYSTQTVAIPREKRYFTVDEATRTLPLVRRIVRDITTVYRHVQALRDHLDYLRATGHDAAAAFEEEEDLLAAEVDKLRSYALELTEIGAQLKDWNMGLVDFPAVHRGREVLLCWRQGEESIRYWHEHGDGFSGRQPVALLGRR